MKSIRRHMNGSLARFLCVRLCCVFFSTVTVIAAYAAAQDRVTTHLRAAAQFLSAGKLESADAELQSVLHKSPQDYRALDLLGVVRVLQHREADAETLFQQATQSKPDFASAHAHLGRLYAH